MPINITVSGKENTAEHKAALFLESKFKEEFASLNVGGDILIKSNVTILGQKSKDFDIIVIGNLFDYSTNLNSKGRYKESDGKIQVEKESDLKKRNIEVKTFCFVIEVKEHVCNDICMKGHHLLVNYQSKSNQHDVTFQSENQKFSLANAIDDKLKYRPYICNFIWLRNVSDTELEGMLDIEDKQLKSHNLLPHSFSIEYLFELACVQNLPWELRYSDGTPTGNNIFKSTYRDDQLLNLNEYKDIFNLFEEVRQCVGQSTSEKIDRITRKLLTNQKYKEDIGNKLLIFTGQAGSGKTMHLSTIATNLTTYENKRCLVLTYNQALVSDLSRLFALSNIPNEDDAKALNILTLHKFIYELLISLDVHVMKSKRGNPYIPNFLKNYDENLKKVNSLLSLKDDSTRLKQISNHQLLNWDTILIDESQDWSETEKEVLFKLFGKEKLIISDGVDQLIRSKTRLSWKNKLRLNIDYRNTPLRKCLRQNVNLVYFVNKTAELMNLGNWQIEPTEELLGGKVVISTQPYSKELHEQEYKILKDNKNTAYEMMFVAPPSLVKREKSKSRYNNEEENINRSFLLKESFDEMGINIWDGTNNETRSIYPIDNEHHRVLQYDSCRGLEGSTVVCLEFDEFIKYKMETYEFDTGPSPELALESPEEIKERHINLWALIPLTRAKDRLVITLKNKDSEIGKIFREIYLENQDFIQWID
jgi:hypothetical protein